jgi:hypothetical protein
MVEIDPRVEDADRRAPPVPRRVGVDELGGAGVTGGQVRVDPRRPYAGRRLRTGILETVGRRIW